ncbi:MAG TPA: hypothetical protein VGH86_09745 [Phenylobacterium sp.]
MTNPAASPELVPNLTKTGVAIGVLAQNDTNFRAAVDAFRAADAESFQRILSVSKVDIDCDLVCRWIRIKECVLRCIEFCGPPTGDPVTVADIPKFAEIIARITGDEELIERLVDAIQDRDPEAYRRLVGELKIERFCHLLCFWACQVHARLLCEIVCAPEPPPRRHFINELAIAGAAIGSLAKDREVLAQVIKGAEAVDCEILAGLLGQGGSCFYICEWICSWHCVLNCLRLCAQFPFALESSIEEMRAFAAACHKLAGTPGAIAKLVDAVGAENGEAYAALVKEFQLERFCIQLCHWICFEICRIFCFCVCPPPETIPLFTHVGSYRVDPIWGDFTADGTTTVGDLAFTSTNPLIGILPDGTTPTSMEYRFLTEKYPLGGGPVVMSAAQIAPTVIGQLEYWYWDAVALAWKLTSANYWVNQPDPAQNTITINQPGPPLTVSVNKTVSAPDGWIAVPRENNLVFGGVGRFVPTGGLANLITTTLTDEVFGSVAVPLPILAGDSVPAADQSEKPHYKISFESRNAVTHAAISANDRVKIALSNTTYAYNLHPDWAGNPPAPVNPRTALVSLDIQELISGGGCNHLHGHIHVLFTAYHPYLGTCEVYIQGPGVPPPAAVFPAISAIGEATSPAGGQDFDMSAAKPCAYIAWITTTLNLTAGYGKLGGEFDDWIAFCTE